MIDQKLGREKSDKVSPVYSKTKKNMYDAIRPIYLELLANEEKFIDTEVLSCTSLSKHISRFLSFRSNKRL